MLAGRGPAAPTYVCGLFTAAGVELDDERMSAVAGQVRSWRFRFLPQADRDALEPVRVAGATGSAARRALTAVDPAAGRAGNGSGGDTAAGVGWRCVG